MFVLSGCVDMYESRLLSWPMYFWYSRGRPAIDRFRGSGLRRYQSATRSWPSGLAWTIRMTTSRRSRRVSSSSPLTSR